MTERGQVGPPQLRLRVAICVATSNRPHGLRRLLGSLRRQRYPAVSTPRVEVVVVDNSRSGLEVRAQEELSGLAGAALRVLHEPTAGIPYARNAAVAAAIEDNDFLAFVDDDEAVSDQWLDALLAVAHTCEADAVCGPAVRLFARRPPRWVLRGVSGRRPRRATGTAVPVCYTHNVLVRSGVFRTMPVWFDERLALTGGSDTEFFLRAAGHGYRFVYAADAVVWAFVPPHRSTLRWWLRHAFRVGQNEALRLRHGGAGARRWARYGLGAGYRTARGVGAALLGLARGWHGALTGLQQTANGLGRLTGAAGLVYEPYRRSRPEAVATSWYCLPEDSATVQRLWAPELAGSVVEAEQW